MENWRQEMNEMIEEENKKRYEQMCENRISITKPLTQLKKLNKVCNNTVFFGDCYGESYHTKYDHRTRTYQFVCDCVDKKCNHCQLHICGHCYDYCPVCGRDFD